MYRSRSSFRNHTGTYVDAPSHILDNGLPVDKLELEGLMVMADVLDFSSLGGALTAGILEKAFKNTGISDNISILLLKTEDSSRKQKGARVINYQNEKSGKEEFGSAYPDESAVFWIIEKKFKTIGIDSFSVDSLHSETLPAHHNFFQST